MHFIFLNILAKLKMWCKPICGLVVGWPMLVWSDAGLKNVPKKFNKKAKLLCCKENNNIDPPFVLKAPRKSVNNSVCTV